MAAICTMRSEKIIMTNPGTVIIDIEAAGVRLPGDPISTEEMLAPLGNRVSDDLRASVRNMGIETRYSVLNDYPGYVAGRAARRFALSTTRLAAGAVEACLDDWGGDSGRIGLVIAITNTADRPLPCLAYELLALFQGRLAHDVSVLNLQNMGCSSFIKAVETARMFIGHHPGQKALIVTVEAMSGLAETLQADRYHSFREILSSRDEATRPEALRHMQRFLLSALFGDAAVAFIVGASDHSGRLGFGPVAHATNLEVADTEILRMNEGGIQVPVPDGFPFYIMGDEVPRRGSAYVSDLVSRLTRRLGEDEGLSPRDLFQFFNIHTGSKKIRSKVFIQLQVDGAGPQAGESFGVLSRYANTSCCSVGLMLAERCKAPAPDQLGLVVTFGVGFSASAAIVGTSWDRVRLH